MIEKSTKIIIVEDNLIFREALTLLINSSKHYEVINSYGNCEDAIENIFRDAPSIVIMDLNLPSLSGIEGIRIIKKMLPEVNILVISANANKKAVFEAFTAGATGFITKDAEYIDFMEAIREVEEGGSPMSKNIARVVVESFHCKYESPLSERETQVLQLLSMGKTYREIADKLYIHPETVKSHLKNIYTKLGVHNKADAIVKAIHEKLFNIEII